jgi:UDP-glucose 4-epimerase
MSAEMSGSASSEVDAAELRRGFAGRHVLITGGLGFVGSNLARELVDLDAIVTVVDSLVPEYGGNTFNLGGLEGRIRINISDVRDPYSIAYLVQGQEYLFNLAGQTSHLDSMSDPFTDLAINCTAQLSILEACRNHNPEIRVVFASTRQFYGRPEYLPVDERHPLHPVDVNGVNKMAGEWYHTLYHEVYGIRTASLRLTNTYGPRMRVRDARQTFLGVWIRRVLEGEPFEVWQGDQLRDFTYVDDAVEALLLAAAHPAAVGKTYNLGGLETVNLVDVAKVLSALQPGSRYEVKDFPAERKRIDIGSFYSDYRHIARELGWRPCVPLDEGLARTLDFYRAHLARYV